MEIVSVEDVVRREREKAKAEIRKVYAGGSPENFQDTQFTPKAIAILKSGEVLPPFEFGFRSTSQESKMLLACAILAVLVDAAALIMVTEGVGVHLDSEREPFRSMMAEAKGDQEVFYKLVDKWKASFGGYVWNLPEEFLADMLIVASSSPGGYFSAVSKFKRSQNPIIFEDKEEASYCGPAIPPWWDEAFLKDVKPIVEHIQAHLTNYDSKKELVERYGEMVKGAYREAMMKMALAAMFGIK